LATRGRQVARLVGIAEGEAAIDQAGHHAALALDFLFQFAMAAEIPDRGTDDGEQRVGRERLGQVVVGAGLQAFEHVGLGRHAGLHDHRHAAHVGALLDPAQDLDAVHVRHHAVEQDRVETPRIGIDQLPGGLAGFGIEHVVTLGPQVFGQHLAADRLVIDNQNATLRHRRLHQINGSHFNRPRHSDRTQPLGGPLPGRRPPARQAVSR
jgi:hypothetical protein